jgi:hypothetical protein
MFKIALASEEALSCWREARPPPDQAGKVGEIELRPEAGFRTATMTVELAPTRAWVQVPRPLLDDPEALAAFVDYRLIVRLCTAENQALVRGPRGLLRAEGIRICAPAGDLAAALRGGCNEVEQVGGSADGVILNPADYWALLGQGRLLADLAENGVRIARTRMVEPGQALIGDFAAGATLFDGCRSNIRFAEAPPGTFAEPGLALCGEIHEALAVHLPTHFFHVSVKAR